MEKKTCRIVIIGVIAALALLGVCAAFANGATPPGKSADAVAILKSQGVSCGSCASKIEKALMDRAGVAAVAVDVDNGRVTAAYDSGAIKPEQIADTVTALGYGSSVVRTLSLAEYRAIVGKGVSSQDAPRGGCGGGCCNKNRKAN